MTLIHKYEAQIKDLKKELAKAHAETITVRNYWFDVANDMENEKHKEINKITKKYKNMEKRALKAEKQRDDALDKITEQRKEIYRLGIELEEEKGTPAEDYNGIIVQDHEKTFYKYGSAHQECLEILNTAKEEYEYEPPNDYYRDGFNLYKRMQEYMESHLLFLHDNRVPTTNNEAERDLRSYKRKQKQAVSFRSFESIEYLCQCMSMLLMMRKNDESNLFDRVSKIFG